MLNWVAILAFSALTAAAARRLIGLWRETRKLPELLIAILILGVGTVAVGGGFVIRSLMPPGTLREIALFVPFVGADVGMAALCIFTWRVYRPASALARAAAATVVASMIGLVGYAAVVGSALVLETGRASLVVSAIYVGVMGWSAVEAFLYWTALRRRLRLGLAEPLVTNRVLLWGIATGTACVGIAIGAGARIWLGIVDFQDSWVALCYAAHGFVAAIGFWLAFNPPPAYARWVVDSAARRAEAG